MLSFSQQQDMRAQRQNINDVVARMVRLLQRTLGEHYEFHLAQASNLWEVYLDVTQLETALLNLALNARDAMPGGGGIAISTENTMLDEVYCATNPTARPGEYVCLSVSDTGEGIAPEIIGRVFDPYFTTKTVGKGSGLGLSMIYGFVKQSGGHVRIYSEQGHGTTVRLYLPRYRPERDQDAAAPASGRSARLVRNRAGGRGRCPGTPDGTHAIAGSRLPGAARRDRTGRPRDPARPARHRPALHRRHHAGWHVGADLAEAARALRPNLRILFTSGFTGAGEQLSRVLAIGPLITQALSQDGTGTSRAGRARKEELTPYSRRGQTTTCMGPVKRAITASSTQLPQWSFP